MIDVLQFYEAFKEYFINGFWHLIDILQGKSQQTRKYQFKTRNRNNKENCF